MSKNMEEFPDCEVRVIKTKYLNYYRNAFDYRDQMEMGTFSKFYKDFD